MFFLWHSKQNPGNLNSIASRWGSSANMGSRAAVGQDWALGWQQGPAPGTALPCEHLENLVLNETGGKKNKASCRHKKFKSISTCFQLISLDDSWKQPRLVVPVNYSKPHTSFAAEWCKRMCSVPISRSDWGKGRRHHWVTSCFPHRKGETGRGSSWPHSTATLSPWNLTSSWRIWWAGCRAGLIMFYLKIMNVMAFCKGSGL